MFQSPSLRGSGRFSPDPDWIGRGGPRPPFQSPSLRGSGRFPPEHGWIRFLEVFQSPSLRGSGRFARSPQGGGQGAEGVSNPFIAGQWSLRAMSLYVANYQLGFQSPSLRGSGRFGMAQPGRVLSRLRFNPLHCGAVVASGPRPIQIGSGGEGFNPLHCGAVVASPPSCGGGAARRGVSIPFIAGQWSLLGGAAAGTLAVAMFQSPSLRGSGRFTATTSPWRCCLSRFQSPSLRGSGRFIAPKTAFQR